MQATLAQLLDGHDLTRDEAREAMNTIMSGEATPAQIGGFLVALRLKGETADEIAGCAEAMRAHVLAVKPQREDLVDTAGTGGDGGRTFNISTAAALVAAAAGAGVAKHGNRAVSSASGSADVLEALGFQLELPPERIALSIDELGFGFLFAPTHHPAMRHAASVRQELGTRTVFNVLGPLTNPAGARAQVVGVYSPDLVRTLAEVLATLGARRAFVVHGAGGIDELSPAGTNLVCEVVDGGIREREIDPLELGVARCAPEDLRGGSPEENAQAIRDVFAGGNGGRRDAILLNAAGAIAAGGHAADLQEGLEIARKTVESGAADCGVQAELALGGRFASRRRSRRPGGRLRAGRRLGDLDPRRRALRRRLGRSPRRTRRHGRAASGQGLLLEPLPSSGRARERSRRGAPASSRSRRPDHIGADANGERA
jgi:anthranilate phosphoribosyltransferase